MKRPGIFVIGILFFGAKIFPQTAAGISETIRNSMKKSDNIPISGSGFGVTGGPASAGAFQEAEISSASEEKHFSLEEIAQQGIVPTKTIAQKTGLGIIKLNQPHGTVDYWIGLHNMYVITHYNTDVKYGMVVLLLGKQIKSSLQPKQQPQS